MLGRVAFVSATALALAACNGAGATRDQIKAVGSSTVYPFTKAVAEAFHAKYPDAKAPVIESTGTGAGFKQFCAGIGSAFPDIADASRRITRKEYETCQANGAAELLEIPIGIDGVAIAESNKGARLQLTLKDIYLALAANPKGKPTTAKTWKDVNPALPAIPIQVYGPPSTSGTRDALMELMVEPGCKAAYPEAEAIKKSGDTAKYDSICKRIRDDGAYVDKGENDNIIVQSLSTNPNAVGVFGYSYLEENEDRIHGTPIEGVAPTAETIGNGKYPGARLLYIYVKKRHIPAVPGLADFLNLYGAMWNPDGELAKRGLIPASERTRRAAAYTVEAAEPLNPAEL
jgi:phosphate transport system substrate-binding protein